MSDGEGRRKEKKIAPFGKKIGEKRQEKVLGKLIDRRRTKVRLVLVPPREKTPFFPEGWGKIFFVLMLAKKRKTKITTKRLFRLS